MTKDGIDMAAEKIFCWIHCNNYSECTKSDEERDKCGTFMVLNERYSKEEKNNN